MSERVGWRGRSAGALATHARAGAGDWSEKRFRWLASISGHDSVVRLMVISPLICSTAVLAIALLSM
jgi:hypothetical protein